MKKLLKYLRPYWKSALLAPALMLIEVVTDLLQPTLMASIIDNGVNRGDTAFIIRTGLIMIGIALLGFLGGFGCVAASSYAGLNMGTDLRSVTFGKVQQFSFGNLDKFKTSSLITRLTNDIVQVQTVVMMSLRMLVRAPMLCIGGIVMAVGINSGLAFIFIAAIPVITISIAFVIKKGFPLFTAVQQKLDRVNAVMRESLSGVRVIKAFVRSDFERSRFKTANEELTDVTVGASRLMVSIMPVMMLVMNLSVVAVIWFGGIKANSGDMQVGEIMAFINYMTMILFSLLMVAFVLMMFSRAKASADRINEVLETDVDVADRPGVSDRPVKSGGIEFWDVSFMYEGAGGDPVLKNVSFSVSPGETVAILGGTGSGKSSLVHLIARLYDVTGGSVLVDGRDVREFKLDTLRRGIGFVLQEAVLFSGTIRDNLRWGNKAASDEEIIEAAKAAEAHDFITGFKDGYETLLGQRGVNLSGGQKQRLSIARALVKRPPILILDDSTSAVDMGTESRIQLALKRLLKNTTSIVIAQRISTVLDADRILVLEEGQIAGQGSHEELLRTNEVYQEICRSQLGEEALKYVGQ